jgi:hypothetical protein
MATTLMHEAARAEHALRNGSGRACPCCVSGWHRPTVRQAEKQRARRREERAWRLEVANDAD